MGQGKWIWPLAAFLLLGIAWLALRDRGQDAIGAFPAQAHNESTLEDSPRHGPPSTSSPSEQRPPNSLNEKGLHQTGPHTVAGVRIVNINSGDVLPIHVVDLEPTLTRIAAGKKDRHHNDGEVFQNRSGSLPKKPRGYYREYVVRTPGVSGPGPQRLVIGGEGEIYYTPDHYDTFIRLESKE